MLLMTAATGAWATDVTIATNQQQTSYTSGDITISVSMVGDGDGAQVSSWCPMTITCGDGNVLQSVVVTIGYYPDNASNVTASAGSCEVSGDGNKHSTYVTVTGINASSVSIGCNGDVQIEQVVVNYSPSAWADADVTWNSSNVSDIQFWGGAPDGYDSYTKEGITLRGNADQCDAEWAEFGNGPGIMFAMNAPGGYTFTAPDGKKFTKIEITATTNEGWYTYAFFSQLESGWPAGEAAAADFNSTLKFTWTGSAASVNLATTLNSFGPSLASSIDFYFEASPEPAEPSSYTVTLKDGTDDADKWTITPAEATTTGVAQGTQVEAKYSGWKLVKSVKATKKGGAAAGPTAYTLAESSQGMIVGTDGKAYDVADKDNLPSGVTAAGVVVYKNGANGLAIALTDEASMMDWATACGESGAAAHTPTVEGQTWKLPSQAEWQQMFSANGGNQDSYTGLNTALAAAGGNSSKLQEEKYWSSSENDPGVRAYYVLLDFGDAYWSNGSEGFVFQVRACLAF